MVRKRKQCILALLLFVNIIMLVIPVLPHHHHPNGMICMKHDLPADNDCPEHHHNHDSNDSCCKNECLTRFDSPRPSMHIDHGPQFILIAVLFTYDIIENLLQPQDKGLNLRYAFYRESLHGTNISRAFSLRAPPAL